jgi:regulator of ribonuclease activity A
VAATSDVLDEHGDRAAVCLLPFRSFGAPAFSGRVSTVRCHEDNVLLRRSASGPGEGRVLVVDGGGSLRCALLGDMIAKLALDNGWAGIVLNGCVRDSVALDALGLGVKALGTCPRPSGKQGARRGRRAGPLRRDRVRSRRDAPRGRRRRRRAAGRLVMQPATFAGSPARDHAARCRVLGRVHSAAMNATCVLASLGARDPGSGQRSRSHH